jgi:NAD(P)H-dependent FMN reductase
MEKNLKVLVVPGSVRTGSYNKALADQAVIALKKCGVEPTLLDLKELSLPIYNGDDEAANGLPENAVKIKELMIEHEAFLFVTPEYNGFIPPLLKNMIDWASRQQTAEEPRLKAFKEKKAAIMSASPGVWGGQRAAANLRDLLENINVVVFPDFFSVAKADKIFDGAGNLLEEKLASNLQNFMENAISALRSMLE